MQQELDDTKLRISELENALQITDHKNTIEYQKVEREREREYKRKDKLTEALRTIGQFER